MTQYNYAMVKINHPDWSKESYFLDQLKRKPKDWRYKKSAKYVFIEKQVFADGSEGKNYIAYSSNMDELQKRLDKYVSWYNYVTGYYKEMQQNVLKLA